MEIGRQIHDKLLTDFAALKFSNNSALFNNVEKYYASSQMEARDCLIKATSVPENVEGGSAGNFQTTRMYSFSAFTFEQIEASDTTAAGKIKYSRLLNILDSILDYLQKEPSNLNAWGASNSINIYKIRVNNPVFDTVQTEGGYSEVLEVPFTIYLNVIPQNL